MKKYKRIAALLLAALLTLTLFAACGETAPEDDEVADENKTFAQAGGSVSLPDAMSIPGDNNSLVKEFDETTGTLCGAFSLTNYRALGYYYPAADSITFTVNTKLDTVTKYDEGFVSLWVKGDGATEFVSAVYFHCDETNQTYTFSGLDKNKQYQIKITYTQIPSYKMSGVFSVTGLATESDEDITVVAE